MLGGGETTKINLIMCLPNREKRVVSIFKKEKLVPVIARHLNFKNFEIVISFVDNVVHVGLSVEDCDTLRLIR